MKTTLTRNSFRFGVHSSFDPFSSFVRKPSRHRSRHFISMLVDRVAQKSDLLPVTTTPFTEQEMNSQAKPLAKRELAVEGG